MRCATGSRRAALLFLLLPSASCSEVHYDSSAATYLLTIVSAQADFREHDRDENNVPDYWVRDVAGLYGFDPGKGPLQIIVLDLAQADQTPGKAAYKTVAQQKPYLRYSFAALKRYQESGKSVSYDDGTGRNRSRFGFVAYPAEYSDTSTLTFIINEKKTMYSKNTQGKPPEEFPEDPVKEGWKALSR